MAKRGVLPAVLLVAATLLATAPAQAQSGDVLPYDFPASTRSVGAVELVARAQDTLRFQFDQAGFNETRNETLQAAFAVLSRGSDRIDVSLAAAGPLWTGDLPVATPALVEGAWSVRLLTVDTVGTQTAVGPTRGLIVLANDTRAPSIGFLGEVGGVVALGPSDVLAMSINDSLLRQVFYTLPGVQGEVSLAAPYVLVGGTFVEGTQRLTVRATDRAGHETSRSVTVRLDTRAPELNATLPERLFVGVPAVVTVKSNDSSNYTVSSEINGTLRSLTGNRGTQTFPVFANATGPVTVTVRARDALGNVAERVLQANASIAETDAAVTFAEVLPATAFAGDPLILRATVEQVTGVTPLDLSVRLSGGADTNRTVAVPGPGAKVVDLPLTLPAGHHRIKVSVDAPGNVTETNTSNQDTIVDVEVYFGRVRDGDATYLIRSGPLGFPAVALGPDNKTYSLRLVDSGPASKYAFTIADGNRTLEWDPLHPDTGASPATGSSSSSSGDAQGAPAPVAPVLMALLAALALLRRRSA